MTKKFSILALSAALFFSGETSAHFVELTANTDFVTSGENKEVSVDMSFTHPFENGPLMTMERPAQFGVMHKGKKKDLLGNLKSVAGFEKLKWKTDYKLDRIGDYAFYVEPKPYFEPAESKFIVHYTKMIVSNGGGDNWDQLVGLPVEIRPLSRPYGLWANNIFRGEVLQNGKPVPYAEIEVEYKNTPKLEAPHDGFVTQVIKADANGVFAYAMPKAGWWGFAALIEDGETKKADDGKEYVIEKGALIWVKTEDMK